MRQPLLCDHHHEIDRAGWHLSMLDGLPHWYPTHLDRPHPDTTTQYPTLRRLFSTYALR